MVRYHYGRYHTVPYHTVRGRRYEEESLRFGYAKTIAYVKSLGEKIKKKCINGLQMPCEVFLCVVCVDEIYVHICSR